MKKAAIGLIVAPVMLLAACASDDLTLDKALGGDSDAATVDLAEAYPAAKSLFIVCTSDDAAVADVFGRNVLEEPRDDENWMVQQRFDSVILPEAYKRDEVDLCKGDREGIREVTNEQIDFQLEGDKWVLQGVHGTAAQDLSSSPVQ
ncbi:hypothetical protein [Corynebacterium fournieri]|uniref:hypothetical protein n=1 Tax=Corynebacterium fournieri TaxID=1852390 RepID=UPI0011789C8A|nr:hypothetical protein [Corynebacterium fournieri]WJY96885.1 hypothetical protein CFOUR_02235 [Corynebacterium fournieri]